jgi:hypothetical protein
MHLDTRGSHPGLSLIKERQVYPSFNAIVSCRQSFLCRRSLGCRRAAPHAAGDD